MLEEIEVGENDDDDEGVDVDLDERPDNDEDDLDDEEYDEEDVDVSPSEIDAEMEAISYLGRNNRGTNMRRRNLLIEERRMFRERVDASRLFGIPEEDSEDGEPDAEETNDESEVSAVIDDSYVCETQIT